MKLNIKKSRLEIHRTTKKKALEYLEYIPEELKEYSKAMNSYESKAFSIVDISEILKSIHQSQVIYLGDFHTFDQSSKNLERLLKTFFTKTNNMAIGVEFVHIKHQKAIDNYLRNIITEREFLETINYKESWRFPWIHYKVFFQLAKENGFNIIALNSEGPLANRDKEAASVIAKNISNNQYQHFFVLFGELHILPDRLPKLTKDLCSSPISQIVIHQNLEEIYWRIYEEADEKLASESIIVKFSNKEFSLQNSPPWIKYESMIYWYENLCDDPEFDLHDYIIETGLKSFNGNVYENFLYLCRQLNDTLNFQLQDEELEDFNIYDHTSLETIIEKINQLNLNNEVREFYEGLIHQGELFHIAGTNSYYCPSYSINRISIIAGFHVSNLIQNKTPLPATSEKILGYLIYTNYIGYFSSKVFNPFRKCDLYLDLVKKSQYQEEKSWQTICLKIIRDEISTDSLVNITLLDIFNIAKQIGNMMADLSFYSTSDNNIIYERIINHLIKRNYHFESVRKLINELILSTPNFYQRSKVIL